MLVRPLAVARCDLDVAMVQGALFPPPFVVGHEVVGEVVAVGAQVRTWQVGARALVPFQVSCGTCDACLAGRTSTCRTYRASAGAAFGFGSAGGGHGGAVAERLAVPHADHLLVAAPDGLDPALAATLPDNVVDGWRAAGPALLLEPGADVLVVGALAPSVGVYAAGCAVAAGASRVRYVDGDPERLRLAEAMGAEPVEHHGEWPGRFPPARITVENTGTPEGLATTLRSTDDDGTCTSVAIHLGDVPFPLLAAYTRGLTFSTSRADSRRHLAAVLDLLATGRLHLSAVPLTRAPFDAAADVWLQSAHKLVLDGPA